jgi:hypothetical protein
MLKKTWNLVEILRNDNYYETRLKFWAWGTVIVVFFSWLLIPIGGIIGWNTTNTTIPMHFLSAGIGLVAGVGIGFLVKMFWLMLGDALGFGEE